MGLLKGLKQGSLSVYISLEQPLEAVAGRYRTMEAQLLAPAQCLRPAYAPEVPCGINSIYPTFRAHGKVKMFVHLDQNAGKNAIKGTKIEIFYFLLLSLLTCHGAFIFYLRSFEEKYKQHFKL